MRLLKFLSSKKKYFTVLIIFCLLTGILFFNFIFKGLLPMPLGALVGGYYPWRDEIWLGKIAGFPIKNFQIRDVIRQLYPWKQLAITEFKKGQFPLWNPYNFTGTPHLANIFVSALSPFNIVFFILPFVLAWGIYITLQPIFVALAFYIFSKNLKLRDNAAIFGSVIFAFSSFLMTRLEFGMVGYTAMWLPLALFSIDKFCLDKKTRWFFLAVFSLACSVLAGYFQVTIYIHLIFILYGIFRFWEKKCPRALLMVFGSVIFAFLLTGIQLFPFLEASLKSARINNYGKENFFGEGYFLPFDRLITFLIPDFFGNDATGNFWGKTSYYEFSGYIGIIPLFFVLFSLFFIKKTKVILFWLGTFLMDLTLALPTPVSLSFYRLGIPGFSVLIPSRIIFIIDFSLAILAGFGFHFFQEKIEKRADHAFLSIFILISCFLLITLVFLKGVIFWPLWQKNYLIALRNSILPIFSLAVLITGLVIYLRSKNFKIQRLVIVIFFFSVSFVLLRNAKKYNPFLDSQLLFPSTKVIDFLKAQSSEPSRILITHQELMTANTNIPYGLEMIDGYDSVHSQRFQELVMAANSENPSGRFDSPGRSVFLTNYRSSIFDLVNVKYVLALEDIVNPKLELIFKYGETRVYENIKSYPRVYLTREVKTISKDEEILKELMRFTSEGKKEVILEEPVVLKGAEIEDRQYFKAEIVDYQPQNVKIITEAPSEAILVFSDAYNSGWRALVDGKESKVYRANYNFRAVIVPEGNHKVYFAYQPLSFKIGSCLSVITFIGLLFSLIPLIKKGYF